MVDLSARYENDSALRRSFIQYLSNLILDRRLSLFEKVLSNRTRYMTIVLEDIFQSQNASAVLRSCDCLGIQDIHVIENSNVFNVNTEVDMGASKWLSIYRYNEGLYNTTKALNILKEKGYRIVATSPHEKSRCLKDFDVLKGPFALLFGTELTGLSNGAMKMADEFISIPMYGFTESYNISVSAALSMYDLIHRLKNTEIPIALTPNEHENIMLSWLTKTVKDWQMVEKRFLEEYYK